jgi:chorismate mutase / prephenate dehydratase
MNIPDHRKAIDRLDAQIIKLLNERTRHVLAIGDLKFQIGQEIYAPHRERGVLQRVCKLNHGPITNESLKSIYREVMSSALTLQKTMTIAYFGPEATFTHQAAMKRFGGSLKYSAQNTIAEVFAEVSRKRADYGVVPVENSTEGVVTHTLDMLVDSDLKIVAQIVTPIQHCLVGRCSLPQITTLYSHPQALAQCRNWLQQHLPKTEIIEASSTTRAAALAAKAPKSAAIASALAAVRYNLEIIDQDIQDNQDNATRFLVLGRQCSPPTGHDRTSLLLSVADKVGALFHTLAPLWKARVNMTKIESRPSKRKAWEYFFFIDCDGHIDDPNVIRAINELKPHCNFVKVLGSYPNTD